MASGRIWRWLRRLAGSFDRLPRYVRQQISTGNHSAALAAIRTAASAGRDRALLLRLEIDVRISLGELDAVEALSRELQALRPSSHLPHFFRGVSFFFRNQTQTAIDQLHAAVFLSPTHLESRYLLADSYARLGRKEAAREILEQLLQASSLPRTWTALANLVDTREEFSRLLILWNAWPRKSAYQVNCLEYIALGALRVGDYEFAKQCWRQSILLARKIGYSRLRRRRPRYSAQLAERALCDLDDVLSASGIEFFLVSGTLLGCVRDQSLLGHDKDIDIGIWDTADRGMVLDVLDSCGRFRRRTSRSKELIGIRHINGTNIDIFVHHREPDVIWHGGVKIRWDNTPFGLVPCDFLGRRFLIPSNADRYLTENYGDWKVPVTDFDSAYDTPNARVLCSEELTVHTYRMLLGSLIRNVPERTAFYLGKLRELGEPALEV